MILNGVDFSVYPKRVCNPGGHRLILCGSMNNRPNYVMQPVFFSLEVFPEIQQRYPEAMLEVVGGNPVPEVLESTEYVYAVSRLFENRQLRKQLSEKARSLMEQKYTWERAGKLYEQVLSGHQD